VSGSCVVGRRVEARSEQSLHPACRLSLSGRALSGQGRLACVVADCSATEFCPARDGKWRPPGSGISGSGISRRARQLAAATRRGACSACSFCVWFARGGKGSRCAEACAASLGCRAWLSGREADTQCERQSRPSGSDGLVLVEREEAV
jgi:hypothetical protein